jgi:hypothetical protein
MQTRVSALAPLALGMLAAATLAAQTPNYHVIKRTVLGRQRADYLTLDPEGRRLYGIGNTVINVDKDTVVDTIPGGGGGYVIAHDQNRGLVRNGTVFDLTTDAVTGHLDMRADGIRYDPVTHRGFTWEGKDAWVVDMRTGQLITKGTLGDGLESGVADGHGNNTNARVVKFSKDGKFIKTWGRKGTAQGEFDMPHAIALDSKGRLFVGDRGNNRIQIFDQDGNPGQRGEV